MLLDIATTALHQQGRYFDLLPIYHDLNQRFFAGTIQATIRWGRRLAPSTRKRSIRLGSYNPNNKVIVIHPCMDQAIVPRICVERIVFHEMLHQHQPSRKNARGKLQIHHRDFYAFEKKYPYLQEADAWIKANLNLFLLF